MIMFFMGNLIASYMTMTPPYQCPTPEDRARAWDSGQTCGPSYSCCFTETRGNSTASCCYAYGSDGPYKCCGRTLSDRDFIIIMSVVFGGAGLVFIIIVLVVYIRSRYHRASEPKKKVIVIDNNDDNDISLDE